MTYAIWKRQRNDNIAFVEDLVGLFEGTWEEADSLVDKLNEEDPDVGEGMFGRPLYGYRKGEPPLVTINNYREFIGT
jgi:hypothetical protein